MEFRCFVSRGASLPSPQREITTFYPSLLDRRHDLRQMIEDFFYEIVEPMFGLKCYTFDVYVTGDRRIKLLDFNPWGHSLCLFCLVGTSWKMRKLGRMKKVWS
ncbi:hypothetical protein HPP92_027351 [Vanilla planifolia]|uniref:Cell division cycle protein 123 homolog n=1 Tax=Vanilla planifolia TaxID=51239 RepID=A0A835U7Y1_VANPL|nr:hypothetical protein HPP92_027351 [Vanilla planifolia]